MRYLVFVIPQDNPDDYQGWNSFVDSVDTFEELDDLFYGEPFRNTVLARRKGGGEPTTMTYQVVDTLHQEIIETGRVYIDRKSRLTVEMD